MNPWLYLLSTICAHSCNFPTLQVMLMMMIGMRTIAMSIRFGVNQSTVSLCGASVESVVYFMLSFLYETMWFTMFRYVINTAMVHLRFVYLCVRLFLGHMWVFYASYFILKIWVWQLASMWTLGEKLCVSIVIDLLDFSWWLVFISLPLFHSSTSQYKDHISLIYIPVD